MLGFEESRLMVVAGARRQYWQGSRHQTGTQGDSCDQAFAVGYLGVGVWALSV